jgi:outer membrane protein assembly factor BamB
MNFRPVLWIRVALLQVAALATSSLRAADWPQWRGPDRDGIWREDGIVRTFSEPELKPVWSAAVGPGYSGPTVAGDRVYLTDRVATPEPQERVLCFDRLSGKQLWAHVYACVYRDIDYALGPRAAVTIASGRAFAYGAMGHAHALDARDGRVLWARDLTKEYGVAINVWAVSAAPLVVGDLVIFQVGGAPDACLVALDVKTGQERWRALSGKASYSSPRVVRQGGRDVLLVWTATWLACLEPATGKAIWQVPYKTTKMIINVPDPVLDESGRKILLSSFYDGSFLYGLEADFGAPKLLWQRSGVSERKTDGLHSIIMTPLIRDGHAYGMDSYGEMRCLDLTNGDRVWEDTSVVPKGRWATAYFVQNGDRTWITTEQGEVIIARLTPQGCERISRARFITPDTRLRGREYPIAWSHPAYAHRSLFARNDRELVCISLAASGR